MAIDSVIVFFKCHYMENLIFKGHYTSSNSIIHTKLEMYLFQEDGAHIVYCPALDMSAYGDTDEEAKQAFAKSLSMYFDYCQKKNTLFQDLKNHGWIIKSKKQKKIKAPSFDKMLQTNDLFRDIARNKDYVKYSTEIEIPELA